MDQSEFAHRFQFHPADVQNTVDQHEMIAKGHRNLAIMVDGLVPDGREKSLFVAKLEEAAMWGHAALDRADGPRS